MVHCSAGVGRTGAFIAIDQLLQNIHNRDYVDVFGTVYSLRKNRQVMVFNKDQYIFIYKVILDIVQNDFRFNFRFIDFIHKFMLDIIENRYPKKF